MSYTRPFDIAYKPSNFDNAFRRTFAPKVLLVVHVTGNSRVAAYPEGFATNQSPGADWSYAARNSASADGPSANNYIGRETGATIEMWNPATHAAWSNGDLNKPNLALPGVKYLYDLRQRGINANKGCYREVELSGYPGTFDPTDAQIEACAYFAAIDSIATGLDIKRGVTVLTHADINSVDRQNCAFRPVIREKRLAQLCERALEIRALLQGQPQEPDMPGLALTLPQAYSGTATVVGDGHAFIFVETGLLHAVAAGWTKEVYYKAQLGKDVVTASGSVIPKGTKVVGIGDDFAVLLEQEVSLVPKVVDCADEIAAHDEAKRTEILRALDTVYP